MQKEYQFIQSDLQAIAIADGTILTEPAGQVEAWQYLVDTGLAWKLAGYSVKASILIAEGVIKRPKTYNA